MKCLGCSKELTNEQIKRKKKYCSLLCFNRHRDISGSNNPMYGQKQKQSTKELISKSNKKSEEEKIHRMHVCAQCNKDFEDKRKKAKYCSKRCSELGSVKKNDCPICGKPVKRAGRVYCSKECRGFSERRPIPNCLICGKKTGFYSHKYCSKSCRLESKRILHIQRIQSHLKAGQKVSPFYNKKACDWFIEFDKKNNTNGQHAETKDGERFVHGWWPDYINDDMKIIIEWNESQHYKKDGSLKKKDVNKQKELLDEYPNYEYWIIKESTMEVLKINYIALLERKRGLLNE